MFYINIIFLVLLALAMIRGFFRGLVKEIVSLISLFLAYIAADYFVFGESGVHIFNFSGNKEIDKIAFFWGVFLAIIIILSIMSYIITKIINLVKLGFFNRVGGFFLPESNFFCSLA